jgi:hypothetical protein
VVEHNIYVGEANPKVWDVGKESKESIGVLKAVK